MKFASPFCGCANDPNSWTRVREKRRSLDAIVPLVFVLLSLVVNIRRRIRTWRSRRHCRLDPLSLRLPTSKDAAILRRSLALLVFILLEISCWAFLFAWRLESAILEHGASFDAACGTPLYQVIDPGLALIPRVYMLILIIKSFTTPTDPVSPSRFTLYNPHFLMFYMLSCISASVRCFSYFFTTSEWVSSPATEKSFAIIDLLLSVIILSISATTPSELNQGELLDIDDPDEGIMVLHDGRVVRNGRILSLEANASPLSSITFGWMNSLLHSACKKPLDAGRLWALPLRLRAQENYRYFQSMRQSSSSSSSLVRDIYRANRRSIHYQFATAIVAVVFHYTNPYLLYKLLRFIQTSPDEQPRLVGYLLCGAIFMCNVISTIVASQTLLWGRRWHVTMNNMLHSETFAHTLARDSLDKGENQAINVVSQDIERLAEVASYLHIFYTCPLEILAGMIFLYCLLGNAFLAGLCVMVIALPSTQYINRRLFKIQNQLTEAKSWRIRLTKELLESIRTTKFLAWEHKWEQIIMTVRDDELVKLVKLYTQNTILNLIWFTTPVLVTTIAFAWYTLVDHKHLDPSTAFVSIVLFSMLRDPLNVMPQAYMAYTDAKISLAHINAFLRTPKKKEEPEDNSLNAENTAHPYDDQFKVAFNAATFQLPHDHQQQLFQIPQLEFPPHCLSIVTGRPLSGKTTLLRALLGEIPLVSGTVLLPSRRFKDSRVRDQRNGSLYAHRVAYVSQVPWIQNNTVRENILFFEPWDDARYRAVLYQCELIRDLALLENGDLTLIGDRGVPLPESLKHKISLARAVYSRAKTVLIDDIFSSLDRHTSRLLLEKCIGGELMIHRTIIAVVSDISGPWIRNAKLLVRMEKFTVSSVETQDGLNDWIEANQMRSDLLTQQDASDDRIDILFEQYDIFADDEFFDESSVMRESTRITEDVTPEPTKPKRTAYTTYFGACGGWQFWLVAVLFTILARASTIAESCWLKVWSTMQEQLEPSWIKSAVNRHVLIYLAICMTTVLFNFIRTLLQYRGSLRASNRLFGHLLQAVCHAPLVFFETTTMEQILNRFNKDIETIDSSIGWHVNSLLQTTVGVFGVVLTICNILPEFYIACLIAAFAYAYIGAMYVRASRVLKKLNAASRSPIYTFYDDAIAGLETIRAYGETRAIMKKMFHLLDENMRPFYTLWTTNRWLFVRIEFVGAILSLFIGVFLVYKATDAGLAGIALTFATYLLEYIYWVMRQSTTVDMQFEAVERINEYTEMPQEPPGVVEGSRPPAAWPTTAAIQVRDLTVVIGEDEEQVLKHVSFNIHPGEKIAIIGRPGAEKEALVSCLFRFTEPIRGFIKVDGVNIAWIGVQDLRSRITYISKDGEILRGSVRSNLDPFGEYDDYELFQVLKRVHLMAEDEDGQEQGADNKEGPRAKITDLDMVIGQDGMCLSAVERQLLCIARALLRDCTKLVVYEEAELLPAEEIQVYSVIQQELADSTVLVLPFRLQHALRYDRVMVFEQGNLVEFDEPAELLDNNQTLFRSLMERAGIMDTSLEQDAYYESDT